MINKYIYNLLIVDPLLLNYELLIIEHKIMLIPLIIDYKV